MKMSNVYKPTYKLSRVDYQREIKDSGEEIELVCFYKVDEHIVGNPPSHTKTIDRLLKILKGTGISKITITYLDKNQSKL